jgi:uncharacterized membrane protein SirB2
MMMVYLYKMTYRYGSSSIFEASEDVSSLYAGYQMHVALKDIVTLKISHIHESGFFLHQARKLLIEQFKFKRQEIGPQVLSLRHLSAGFLVICGFLVISIAAFAAECAPKQLKKLFGTCLSIYIVVKFVRMKKML